MSPKSALRKKDPVGSFHTEKGGFEPPRRLPDLSDFKSDTFSLLVTSPHKDEAPGRSRSSLVSPIVDSLPTFVKIVPDTPGSLQVYPAIHLPDIDRHRFF